MSGASRIGLSTGALYPDYTTEDALNVAAEYGYCCVELYIQTRGEYAPSFVSDVKQRMNALELRIHSLHNDTRHFDLWSPYKRRAAESYALFERLIDMAAELGAQAITWHGYDKNFDDDRMFDRFAETAHYLGGRARQAGITVTIENVSWCYVRRVEHIYRIREANLPLGFTFDPFQAMEAEQIPTEIIRAMGDRLTTVHLSDFGLGPIRHMALGEGMINWRSIFRTLDEVDYRGPLIMEAPYRGNLDVVASGRRFVEQQLANLQRSEG